jgi:predicted transcriptional regulator
VPPYMLGYYCPSAIELNILEKESNRKIIDVLRAAYPSGKTAPEISESTGLPLKTTYPQLSELNRAGYIIQLPKKSDNIRGRPKRDEKNNIPSF